MNNLYNNFCLIGNSHTSQFSEDKLIDILYGYGASICGLSNKNSVLKLSDRILEYQQNNPSKVLVFFLGQTDIEFIYYFKSARQNKKLDIIEFIDKLVEDYIYFIKNNISNKCVILGINPTVIENNFHIFKVNFEETNQHNPNGHFDEKAKYSDYQHIYNDSYETRFSYNIIFNNKLKEKCKENNINYCDINKYILDENNNVKYEYMPNYVDHHLVKNKKLFYYLLDELKQFEVINL